MDDATNLPERLDVVAVAPHPDDLEILCGGTLAKLVNQGYRVGIFDLTCGEPTPRGSLEIRKQEAELAAQANDVDGVLTALAQIIVRADGGADDWFTQSAAREVNDKLKNLIDCLEEASGRDFDNDADDDRDHNDDKAANRERQDPQHCQ